MANWVRFADTKATILTAGLGAVLTMLMTNASTIVDVVHQGGWKSCLTGSLAAIAALAACYTLLWLVIAIGPRRQVARSAINRFAWPTLIGLSASELMVHTSLTAVREDAWEQVIALSNLADRKFRACAQATGGFATLVIFGVACIGTAIATKG